MFSATKDTDEKKINVDQQRKKRKNKKKEPQRSKKKGRASTKRDLNYGHARLSLQQIFTSSVSFNDILFIIRYTLKVNAISCTEVFTYLFLRNELD